MLEKPDLPDEKIISCLQAGYGLQVEQVIFLPVGADQNSFAYRIIADNGTPYFLKLRQGLFDEITVELPKFLSDRGIAQIIAPLVAKTGQPWVRLDPFTAILYPFIEGRNGYEAALTDRQWFDFGRALHRIQALLLPPGLKARIPSETYSPQARAIVKQFLAPLEHKPIDEPVAIKTASFLKAHRVEILDLVERAERYARALQARPPELVLCHSDIHAGNILIGSDGAFYIVDWDNPILAPKERDLMFIGGGQGFLGHTAPEEETLFYRGYGQAPVDPTALAYYRYERIIQDIAVFCEQLLLTGEGGADREQSFRYLASNFLPGNTIEIAYQSDKAFTSR